MMKKSKITTKKGDQGQTFGPKGKMVQKDDLFIETVGSLDELQAHLGLMYEYSIKSETFDLLLEIIDILYEIMGYVYVGIEEAKVKTIIRILEKETLMLEQESSLSNQFVRPIGSLYIASAHVARTIARRAERVMYEYLQISKAQLSDSLIFLNRLSDYLFILAVR